MGEAIVMGLGRTLARSRANVCQIIVIIGGSYWDRTSCPCCVSRADGFAVVPRQQLTLHGSVPERLQRPENVSSGPKGVPTFRLIAKNRSRRQWPVGVSCSEWLNRFPEVR